MGIPLLNHCPWQPFLCQATNQQVTRDPRQIIRKSVKCTNIELENGGFPKGIHSLQRSIFRVYIGFLGGVFYLSLICHSSNSFFARISDFALYTCERPHSILPSRKIMQHILVCTFTCLDPVTMGSQHKHLATTSHPHA